MSMSVPTTAYSPMGGWLSAAGNRFLNIAFGGASSQITEHIVNTVAGERIKVEGARLFERAGGKGIGSFGSATIEAFKQVPNKGGLNIFSNFASSFGEIGSAFKGANGSFLTKLKAAGGKAGPIINLLLILGFEIPNIWRSFTHKEGGVVTGTVETGKATLKLGANMAGFAVGSAAGGWLGAKVGALIGSFCGPIGSFVGGAIGFAGGFIGSMLTGAAANKVLGQSFSDKLKQKEQAAQKQMMAMGGGMPQRTANPQMTNPFARQNYAMNGGYKDLSQIYREYMQAQQMIAQGGGYPAPQFGCFA